MAAEEVEVLRQYLCFRVFTILKIKKGRIAKLINVSAYICIRVYWENIVLAVWIERNKASIMSRDRLIELSTIFD